VAVLILLAVVVLGATPRQGATGVALRRGTASIVLSVLVTLAVLFGVATFALLCWASVGRRRERALGDATTRRSPVARALGLVAVFAAITALLALAARHHGRLGSSGAAGAAAAVHSSRSGPPLPFSVPASLVTLGVVMALVAVLAGAALWDSVVWRRALPGMPPTPGSDPEEDSDPTGNGVETSLTRDLAALQIAPATIEVDPRRAVIQCYLSMLEICARQGMVRQTWETPSEFVERLLSNSGAGSASSRRLTGCFEAARYSTGPVTESERSGAAQALDAVRQDLESGVRC